MTALPARVSFFDASLKRSSQVLLQFGSGHPKGGFFLACTFST